MSAGPARRQQANAQAKKQADNKRPESCDTTSFVPGTGVVMADGSVEAIDDVAVGDTVVAVAADGARTHRQGVATITGHSAKDLVGLTLVGSGGGGPPAGETITATDGHLFLTADGQWVPAKDLQVGDQLVDPDGTPVAIAAVEHKSVVATVHNPHRRHRPHVHGRHGRWHRGRHAQRQSHRCHR